MESLLGRPQPTFRGNSEDLEQFVKLCSTQIHTDEREHALADWENYKRERQRSSFPKGRRPHKSVRWLAERVIDLTGANLDDICLGCADLRGVIFNDCWLRGAWMRAGRFENASFLNAHLESIPDGFRGPGRLLHSDLRRADFTNATLTGVDLSSTVLDEATLNGADLSGANLGHSTLVQTQIDGATFRDTRIYGISTWDLSGQPKTQKDLIITPDHDVSLTVDNLEVAQFIYLMLKNAKIRDAIDTITKKVVLILGRFTPERKPLLNSLREALRTTNPPYVPVLFDFEKPVSQTFIETVSTLAHMARFVIADVTDPKIVLHEIPHIVSTIAVPVLPLLKADCGPEPVTLADLRANHHSLLDTVFYQDEDELLQGLNQSVIAPAEASAVKLQLRKVRTSG